MTSPSIPATLRLAAVAALALTLNAQQDEAIRGCRAHAALSTNAYFDDIYVQANTNRRIGRSGNFGLSWEAWVTDERAITGTCESDSRGAIVRFDRLAEKTGRKPSAPSGANVGGGFNNTGQQTSNTGGGFNNTGGGFNNTGGGQQNLGALTAENALRGSFNGLGMNTTIDKGRVVLQNGRATVMLSGGFGGFNRVTLGGQVTRQISDREFEITIDSADRARQATGNILLRLTTAHNEIESIVVNGMSGNQQFGGTFNQ